MLHQYFIILVYWSFLTDLYRYQYVYKNLNKINALFSSDLENCSYICLYKCLTDSDIYIQNPFSKLENDQVDSSDMNLQKTTLIEKDWKESKETSKTQSLSFLLYSLLLSIASSSTYHYYYNSANSILKSSLENEFQQLFIYISSMITKEINQKNYSFAVHVSLLHSLYQYNIVAVLLETIIRIERLLFSTKDWYSYYYQRYSLYLQQPDAANVFWSIQRWCNDESNRAEGSRRLLNW